MGSEMCIRDRYGVFCNRSVSVSLMREGPVLCVVCEGTLQGWFLEVTSASRGNHNCGG